MSSSLGQPRLSPRVAGCPGGRPHLPHPFTLGRDALRLPAHQKPTAGGDAHVPPALLRGCGAWSSNGDKRPEGALGPQGLHGLPGLSPPGGRVARPVLQVAARSLGSGVLALSGPRSSSPSEGHTASSQVRAGASTQAAAARLQVGDCEHGPARAGRLCAHADEPSYPFCYFWPFRV